jgi:hypothetical protein
MKHCCVCHGPAAGPKRGYCLDCGNMQALESLRKTRSLPLLKQRARGWSEARIGFEMQWLSEQMNALLAERHRRRGRAKAAGA